MRNKLQLIWWVLRGKGILANLEVSYLPDNYTNFWNKKGVLISGLHMKEGVKMQISGDVSSTTAVIGPPNA